MDKADVTLMVSTMRQNVVATLTAAIVSARSKPISIAEVLEINRHVHFAMYPEHGLGAYQQWHQRRDEHLAKVYE